MTMSCNERKLPETVISAESSTRKSPQPSIILDHHEQFDSPKFSGGASSNTAPHSKSHRRPEQTGANMAMHNFGPNSLQQEHQQQLKHQQPSNTASDSSWHVNIAGDNPGEARLLGANNKTNNDLSRKLALTNNSGNANRLLNRHHNQQQLQSQQYHGVFSPQIPAGLQSSFESRVDQIIRTTLHDSPAYTPPTAKDGNNNSGHSTASGSMLSPSTSSSHIFNSAPEMMNAPVTSTPLNILGRPPHTNVNSNHPPGQLPTSNYAPPLSLKGDMQKNGPNNKVPAHSSANHTALAAAAALQSLNQSHLQRSQQQLAHTHQAPFLNAAPLTTKPPSNGSGTPVPQAAHINNSQLPRSCLNQMTNSSDNHRNHLASTNGHQDCVGDFAPRSQSIDAGNNPDNGGCKMPQTSSSLNTQPPNWPDHHQNGNMSRFLPHGLGNPGSTFPPSQNPYELNNSIVSLGMNLNNSAGSTVSDNDNLSRLNSMKNLSGQYNSSQIQENPIDTNRGHQNNSINEPNLRLQPAGNIDRITEERLAIFAYNLFSGCVPGKNGYKTIIQLTPEMINSIRDGTFYTHFRHLAAGILMNNIIIPNFSIIDYLRRDRFTLGEVEQIDNVNKQLSVQDLVCLMELVRQRPPARTPSRQAQSGSLNSAPSIPGLNYPQDIGTQISAMRSGLSLMSSSPNRSEMSGPSGIDKSRRSSQSPSEICRSQVGSNSANSKFINVQVPNIQQGQPNQLAQPTFLGNQLRTPQQNTSPQGNRSSPFQSPIMISQQPLPRPPRSHSTIGGLGFGSFSNLPAPLQFPPAAHQSSSRPNLSALAGDILPAHAHSSSIPVTAHMSSKTPQTPKSLPPPPSSANRSAPLSTGISNNKLLFNKSVPISSHVGSAHLPQIKSNDPMAAYRQQQLILSSRLIENGPGALHPMNQVPTHGLNSGNTPMQRAPTSSEPISVDTQSQSRTSSPKANQRSIITGSASAGSKTSRGKRPKPSPSAGTQPSEVKIQNCQETFNGAACTSDMSNNERVELNRQPNSNNLPSIPVNVDEHRLDTAPKHCNTLTSEPKDATSANVGLPLDKADLVPARGLDTRESTLQENTENHSSFSLKQQDLREVLSTNESKSESPTSTDKIATIDEPTSDKYESLISHDQSESNEPSKYHKLYTKKAWLKNYNAEDQSSTFQERSDLDVVVQSTQIKTESETKDPTSNDLTQSKPNGGLKTSKPVKRKTKDDKIKRFSSLQQTKAGKTATKTDNDSEGTTASTSDLDDTDGTDSVKSMADQRLRRMPRRRAKANSDKEITDLQASTKSKASRDEDLTRKRVKKERSSIDSAAASKRKFNSDDESVKQQTKKTKSEDCKPSTVATLKSKKRTGEKFLQTQPCYEIVPKNIRCLECRRVRQSSSKGDKNGQSKQVSRTNWDDFCRFFEFRKLRYNKAGKIVVAGFLESNDAKDCERKLWRSETGREELQGLRNISASSAKFILSNIGQEFCKLVLQERAVETSWRQGNQNKGTTWKRTVNGLRELCDVCSTTLFNCQFVCERCGFVVCIDCCQSRSENDKMNGEDGRPAKEDSSDQNGNGLNDNDQGSTVVKRSKKDSFGWNLCAKNEEHSHDKLTLATIIPPFCLEDLWTQYHDLSRKLNLDPCHECMQSAIVKECDSKDSIAGGFKDRLESEMDRESSHSTLKGLLLSAANTKDDTKEDADVSMKENDLASSRVFDFANEDDSQDDSRQVSAAIEGCIASLNIEGQDDPLDSKVKQEMPIVEDSHLRLCGGDLLVLEHSKDKENRKIFQKHWRLGKPVLVRGIHESMNIDMWLPQFFLSKFGEYRSDLVDCRNGDIHRQSMRKYWDGFEPGPVKKQRVKEETNLTQIPSSNNEEPSAVTTSYYCGSPLWRLKDWPPGQDFKEILPEHYEDFMNNLPLKAYTTRTGKLNLACRLPEEVVSPDLGPKMYSAYGTTKFPERGTTNLHLDISDAINVMVYVSGANSIRQGSTEFADIFDKTVDECNVEPAMKAEIKKHNLIPGALWHLFKPSDTQRMREFLNKVSDERNISPEKRVDPIHDQIWYLDQTLLDRLYEEYGVKSYPILQCMGDAILIPAGAPHQVKNLQNCIKVANDFVSPENIKHCLQLTNEFRRLPETHINQQDKLQIKNIIYYSMKDSVLVSLSDLKTKKVKDSNDCDTGDETDDYDLC